MTTDAKTWRQAREVGIEVEFVVSGFTASIRPLEADFFLLQDGGTVPNAIMQAVLDVIDLKPRNLPKAEEVQKDKDWIAFLNRLCMYAFVSPICKGRGEPLGDGEISVDDIPYGDKVFLYRVFAAPARVLSKFREIQQNRALANLGDGQSQPPATQSSVEGTTMGGSSGGNAGLVDGVAI